MRYNAHFGMLPENAFQKKLGSNRPATLEGGGGGILKTVGQIGGGIVGGMVGGPQGAAIGSQLGSVVGGAIGGGDKGGGGGGGQPQAASSGGGGGGGGGGGYGGYGGGYANRGPGALVANIGGGNSTPIDTTPDVQFAQQIPQQAKEGGLIGHNPQFYSEGGLSSIENQYVSGDGDGTSDSIPAMLANGEFVIPADVVSALGNGSNDSGSDVLSNFLATIRDHKQKHDSKELPPDSKGALAYLTDAKRKTRG